MGWVVRSPWDGTLTLDVATAEDIGSAARQREQLMQQMTTSVWTYREGILKPGVAPRNVVGYGVEALDGAIGKVDDATYEVGSSYLVVDTGPWIFGKKVMLPAGVIRASTTRTRRSSSTGQRTRSRTPPSSTTPSFVTRTTAESSARTTVTPPASASRQVHATVRKGPPTRAFSRSRERVTSVRRRPWSPGNGRWVSSACRRARRRSSPHGRPAQSRLPSWATCRP